MLYRYEIKTLNITAAGVLEAEDEDTLKSILENAYAQDFVNEDGDTIQNEVVELELSEVTNNG